MLIGGVTVTGRNVMLGAFLTTHVEEKMETLSNKYFGRLITCRVVFTKAQKGIKYGCTIQAIVGHNLHYVGEAHTKTVMGSFRLAYEHLAKQMRRAKRAHHEDKPHRHRKIQQLDRLTVPDPASTNGFNLPVDGDQLSIADVEPNTGARVVQSLYGIEKSD